MAMFLDAAWSVDRPSTDRREKENKMQQPANRYVTYVAYTFVEWCVVDATKPEKYAFLLLKHILLLFLEMSHTEDIAYHLCGQFI